jgi:hypothetical protein
MPPEDSQLKVIHDLLCRVDEQRRQLLNIADKLDRLHQEIGREIERGPLSREPKDSVDHPTND